MNDEKYFQISVKTKHVSYVNDILRLLKYVDKNAFMFEVKGPKYVPEFSEFMIEGDRYDKRFSIFVDGKRYNISKIEFVRYCTIILKRHECIECSSQFALLKSYGVTDENFYVLFGFNTDELISLANGEPYPYVEKRWGEVFSTVKVDLIERQQALEAKRMFEEKEELDNKVDWGFRNVRKVSDFVEKLKNMGENNFLKAFPHSNRSTYSRWTNLTEETLSDFIAKNINGLFGTKLRGKACSSYEKISREPSEAFKKFMKDIADGNIVLKDFLSKGLTASMFYSIRDGHVPRNYKMDLMERKFGLK